jgi:DNA polymerase
MAEETTYAGLLDGLEKYLEYQRDNGVLRVEVERAVLQELAAAPGTGGVAPAPEKPAPAPETSAPGKRSAPEALSSLDDLAASVAACRECRLCEVRTRTVPGEGNGREPDIMFIGEGPGADEDAQGRPFVGKAGQLLTKMIDAMGYSREQVYIANIVKCRPPENRAPLPEEMEACLPYLRRQIELIRPRIIIGMGATAIRGLLGKTAGITRLRGTWQEYEGIRLMPTFHPSYLLRDPSKKKAVWQDLQLVLKALGREPPPRNNRQE